MMKDQLDVGQEFAIRWLLKNRPMEKSKAFPVTDEIVLCNDIAMVANAYADKKRAEFERVLRTVMIGVLDGTQSAETIIVCKRDFLESECMKFVANKYKTNAFQRSLRFPTDINS